MNIVVSDGIVVSGVGVPLNAIEWPSGQFNSGEPGSNLCAFLSSVNATFGFNLSPHSIRTEWIPCGDPCSFHGASGQVPDIGKRIELYIGDFFFKGTISHADYTSSSNGTIFNVTLEDERRTLRRVKIHTEDLGEDAPSGVVSVARAYRKLNGLTDLNGDPSDPLIKEYIRILQFGCTYSQILQAVDFHFNENKSYLSAADLPSVAQIESNIGGDVNAIRFQFNLSPVDEAVSRIFQDTGYDWYWSMDAQKINLINKKDTFDISEVDILDLVSEFGGVSGLNDTKQLGFGQDIVPDPTRFRVLGGHQEGFLNSEILSPIDGLDSSALDGNITFNKVWDKISVGFFDADGFYRTYIPQEKELQLALAGIEQWAYYKIYQTSPTFADPAGYGLPPDAGSVAAQDDTFQSRFDPLMPLAAIATGAAESGIKVISNRRDEEHNWVLSFYSRVRDHATRHYGRSYIAEGVLYNEASGFYRLVDAAWANVENQVEGYPLSASGAITTSGIFVQDYEINRDLGPVSPFLSSDFRVRAHCVLPADTVYGPQGDDVPASFGNWTEDAPEFNPNGDGRHYIPVSLTVVGQRVVDPRSNDLYGFEAFPEGTLWCQLPINAGPGSGLAEDNIISNLSTLLTTQNKVSSSGLVDVINPAIVLNVYESLSGVAIPVQSRSRYGQSYPSEWVAGELHYERDEDVQLDDQFVPWAFSPEGNETSLQVMTNRAYRRAEGKIVPRSSSRYADFFQVGLPLLSFDSFAEQNFNSSGIFGAIQHGVSELTINFGLDGFSTRYKIQSYFPQFGREAPLGERNRGFLNGIINPIDFTDLSLLNQTPPDDAGTTQVPGDPYIPPLFFDGEQNVVKVTITEVNNIFTLNTVAFEQERYRGEDENGYEKPPLAFGSSNLDFQQGAVCIDGFLNIGDEALYHTDNFELPGGNVVARYFTQGRPFGNGTIVQVEQVNSTDPNLYDVTIVDPGAFASLGLERAVKGVGVLNGTVAIGDKTTLAVQGDAPKFPSENNGTIFINGTVQDTAGVTPVEIVEVTSNIGTSTARVNCRQLGLGEDAMFSVASGELFTDCVPIPFPELAASGDRGFLTTPASTPSGGFGKTADVTFVQIVRPAYRRFG